MSDLRELLYLLSAVAFIVGLKRLASPATARSGNRIAAGGMLLAVVVTLADRGVVSYWTIAAGLLVGSVVGTVLARRVPMTAMPQLVAVFNGFGGGASALVALAEVVRFPGGPIPVSVAAAVSLAVGAVTFSGSLIAFGKLQGLVDSAPVTFPGKRLVDAVLAGGLLVVAASTIVDAQPASAALLIGIGLIVGVTGTLPIGGADMPVVISFLNSLSGIAASAAGFVIGSNVLIVSGALVGASGLILTRIMVRAMNRTLAGVLAGGFGGQTVVGSGDADQVVRSADPEEVATLLAYASRVVVVPGYGLAVAQAQHELRELTDQLTARGVDVRFAIHPVAGRMPGHMNVLLAEADIPYDRLYDLEDINPEFPHTDVVLVVGANDVVNPSARDDPSSPIYGMPILEVDRAKTVVVVKRSLSPGFAGVDNPLFYREGTFMLFADAKEGLASITGALKEL